MSNKRKSATALNKLLFTTTLILCMGGFMLLLWMDLADGGTSLERLKDSNYSSITNTSLLYSNTLFVRTGRIVQGLSLLVKSELSLQSLPSPYYALRVVVANFEIFGLETLDDCMCRRATRLPRATEGWSTFAQLFCGTRGVRRWNLRRRRALLLCM